MIDNEEKENETRRASFLFLAGMKGIRKHTILEIDPAQEFISLVNELFQKIESKWRDISADYLLSIIIDLIPTELDDVYLNLLSIRLTIIYDVIQLQYGAGRDAYSIITLANAIRAKIEKIAWQDDKCSNEEKENEKRVINIVTEILTEQKKLAASRPQELKKLNSKSNIKDFKGKLLFSFPTNEEIKDQGIICKECHSIYKKIINPSYLNSIHEICIGYKVELEEVIKKEIQKNRRLYKKYFNGKNIEIVYGKIAKDAENKSTEIANFISLNPAFYHDLANYRLICIILSNAAKELDFSSESLTPKVPRTGIHN